MNAPMERWVQTCRRELLDRTLICNQWHLLHALHEFEQFCNSHRPHQGIAKPGHGTRCPHRSPSRTPPLPLHTQTRPPRRHPARVPTCRLTCTDEILGKQTLPAQLSDVELAAIVIEVISEAGASGTTAMGRGMKAVTPRVAGRAEGGRMAAGVRRALAG